MKCSEAERCLHGSTESIAKSIQQQRGIIGRKNLTEASSEKVVPKKIQSAQGRYSEKQSIKQQSKKLLKKRTCKAK